MWILLTLACATQPPAAPPPAAVEAPADAADVPMAPVAERGLISEADFAAAHTLTADAAPPLTGREIELAGGKAWLSTPDGAAKGGVIVIHEWWGLNDHIRHWTDRLAEDGYAAIAVDLYGGTVATTREEAMAAMKTVDEQAARNTLAAAHAYLTDTVGVTRTASLGWCFGGGWSLQTALAQPELDAAVMYYGRPVTDGAALASLNAPVLGVFANRDEGIPPESVDAFAAAMEAAGKPLTLHRYDADHAFANPSGGRYDAASAEDAWTHVRAFLAENLRSDR
jgi:carboxymethylenebutenolidase